MVSWPKAWPGAPQSVTLAQTLNPTRGKTGASCLAKHFGDEVVVVDMGVNAVIRDPKVLDPEDRHGHAGTFT